MFDNGATDATMTGAVETGTESAVETTTDQAESSSQETSSQEMSREEAFEKYFAENKDLFDNKIRAQLDRRFKNAKATQDRLNKAEPILEMIAQRYGMADAKDLDGLFTTVEADDTLFEEEAIRRGMDKDELRKFKRLERENAQLKRESEQAARQRAIDERNAQIAQNAAQTKAKYPSFNFSQELQNPNFVQLVLNAGIDTTTAFEIVHKDELLSGAIGYAAQRAAKATAENIAQRSKRPQENGTSGQAAAQSKPVDPSKLTRKEIEEYTRRALAGEKITF